MNLAAQAFAGAAGVSYPNGWPNVYGQNTLSFTRLEAYMDVGSAGAGYLGPSNVDHLGANKAYVLPPPLTAGQMGGYTLIQIYEAANLGDLAQYWAHGANAGDKMVIVFHQV